MKRRSPDWHFTQSGLALYRTGLSETSSWTRKSGLAVWSPLSDGQESQDWHFGALLTDGQGSQDWHFGTLQMDGRRSPDWQLGICADEAIS